MNPNILVFLLPIAAYLLGAIPVGWIMARRGRGIDVRRVGSGNIGATNVWRVAGTRLGVATFAGDLLKGALPALAAHYLMGRSDPPALPPWYGIGITLCAVVGHMYPIYLKFKPGGKGVATAAGAFGVLAPMACLVALAAFSIMALVTKRASASSLAGAAVLPAALWMTTGDGYMTVGGALVMLLIVYRHRENIHRLLIGTEPRFKGRS